MSSKLVNQINLMVNIFILVTFIHIVQCTYENGEGSTSSTSASTSLTSSSNSASSSHSASLTSNNANPANDKKQEKLINILENLQYSISEILNTLGTPAATPASSSSSSSNRGSRTGKSETSVGSSRNNPPFTQRVEPSTSKDFSSTSSSRESGGRGIKDDKPSINEHDSPPSISGGRAAVTPSDPKKNFPGVAGTGPLTPFRVSWSSYQPELIK